MLHILTLNWNGLNKIKKLYETLIPSLDGIDYCWYIKDNGSSDKSVDFLQSLNNNKIQCIAYGHNNDNYAKGCNVLFDIAKPNDEDYILLLNNDVSFFDIFSIHNMINLWSDDMGIVGAKLLYTYTNKIQHCGVIFTENRKLAGAPALPIHFRRSQQDDIHSSKNRYFQATTAACLLTKAKYYRKVFTDNKSGLPGMNENYFWCFEDVDFCLTINKIMNKKVVVCCNTKIYHEESASLKLNPVNKLYLNSNISILTNRWRNKVDTDVYKYLTNPEYNLYVTK